MVAMVSRRGLIATSALGTNGFSCADSMTLMRRLRRLRKGISHEPNATSPLNT